jgi:hypothetical protein
MITALPVADPMSMPATSMWSLRLFFVVLWSRVLRVVGAIGALSLSLSMRCCAADQPVSS